jgi:hypothetical protein
VGSSPTGPTKPVICIFVNDGRPLREPLVLIRDLRAGRWPTAAAWSLSLGEPQAVTTDISALPAKASADGERPYICDSAMTTGSGLYTPNTIGNEMVLSLGGGVADDALAAELGRRLVAELAPAELPLFDQTWQTLGRRPGRRSRRREEPLGFGLPEAGAMLVTAVASGVVSSVIQDLGKDFGSWLVRALARLRRRPAAVLPDPLPPLSAPRLRQIRQTAHRRARKLGMTEAKASALADVLVSELATMTTES